MQKSDIEHVTVVQHDILPSNVITLRSSEQPFSAGHGVYLGQEAFDKINVECNEMMKRADYAGPI